MCIGCRLEVGTPICILSRGFIDIGHIASVEINHKQVNVVKKGQKVAIKVIGALAIEMFSKSFSSHGAIICFTLIYTDHWQQS